MNINFLVSILNLQVVQIFLIAYIGALLGEMKREQDDDETIVLKNFMLTWLCSGFGGVMFGLMAQGWIGKTFLSLGISGLVGYAGQKKAIEWLIDFLSMIQLTGSSSENEKKKRKKK